MGAVEHEVAGDGGGDTEERYQVVVLVMTRMLGEAAATLFHRRREGVTGVT